LSRAIPKILPSCNRPLNLRRQKCRRAGFHLSSSGPGATAAFLERLTHPYGMPRRLRSLLYRTRHFVGHPRHACR
jgi:hypothetical protein